MKQLAATREGPLLRLLGEPELRYNGVLVAAPTQKALAIVCYLALHRQAVPRETLTELLWGAGRSQNLRQALYRLRSLPGAETWLEGDSSLRVHVVSDVAQLEQALQEQRFADALELWHDADGKAKLLLQGLEPKDAPDFNDWLSEARNRWALRYESCLQGYADALEESRAYNQALQIVDMLLEHDTLNETAHRTAMRLEAQLQHPRAALRRYEQCRKILAQELAIEPAPETIALARDIEKRLLSAPPPEQAAPPLAVGRFRIPPSVLHPPVLAGREQLWEAMQMAWYARQVLLLSAPAGMGKTRLLQDFANAQGEALLLGARPGDSAVPYASCARWLRKLLSLQAAPLAPWVRAELARIVPAQEGGQSSLGDKQTYDAHDAKIRLFEAVCALLAQLSGDYVALVVDDLHFSDAASFELLMYLLGKMIPSSVTSTVVASMRLLLSYRSGELSAEREAQLSQLSQAGVISDVQLSPLDVPAVQDLLGGLRLPGLSAAAERALAALLERHTGGNPLFIIECVKSLLEAGSLSPDDPAEPISLPQTLPLPAKVHALLERRLVRLPPLALKVLRALALLEDRQLEAIAAVVTEDVFQVAEALQALQEAQMLREDNQPAHDLLQETVRHTTPRALQVLLHQRCAAYLEATLGSLPERWAPIALEASPALPSHARRVAEHYLAAARAASSGAQRWQQPAQAWLLQAARLAYYQGRSVDAQTLLKQLLQDSQSPEQGAIHAQAQLEQAYMLLSHDSQRSYRLCQAVQARSERLALPASLRERLCFWAQLGIVQSSVYSQSAQPLEPALQRLDDLTPADLSEIERARLLQVRLELRVRAGSLPEDLSASQQVLHEALKQQPEDKAWQFSLATLQRYSGDLASSTARLAALAEQSPDFAQIMRLHNIVGQQWHWLGELAQAQRWLEQGLRLWLSQEAFYHVAWCRVQLAFVHTSAGRFHDALTLLGQAQQAFEEQGATSGLAMVWHGYGDVHYSAAHYASAEAAYSQALHLLSAVADPADAELCSRSSAGLARSLAALGQWPQAEAALLQSLQSAEQQPLARAIAQQSQAMLLLWQPTASAAQSNSLGEVLELAQHTAQTWQVPELYGELVWLESFHTDHKSPQALRTKLQQAWQDSQQRGLLPLHYRLAQRLSQLSDEARYHDSARRALKRLHAQAPPDWFSAVHPAKD